MQNVQIHQTLEDEPRRERAHRDVAAGGTTVEAILGIAAVVLSILGLAGLLPFTFAGISVIAAGAALLFESLALGVTAVRTDDPERQAMMSGVGADSIAGIGAIALGVLSLIGISPFTLLPAAAIVLGAGLLLSAGASAVVAKERPAEEHMVRRGFAAATGVHVLIGVGAVVLGILGVLGMAPVTLSLVTTLCIGAGLVLGGAALGVRLATLLHPRV